jgi:hypothetical protein
MIYATQVKMSMQHHTMRNAKYACSFLIQPFNPSKLKCFIRLMNTDASILNKIRDFIKNVEENDIHPNILRQQLPDILLLLAKVKSKDSGAMVDQVLDKFKLAGVEFSTRIHRTVGCYKRRCPIQSTLRLTFCPVTLGD